MKNIFFFFLGVCLVCFIWWDVEHKSDMHSDLKSDQQVRLTISLGWNPDQEVGGRACAKRITGRPQHWEVLDVYKEGKWQDEQLVITFKDKWQFLKMRAKLWDILE